MACKKFQCLFPGCGKSFTKSSNLTQHHRCHTGEKPFSCNVCGKTFGQSGNLSKHVKSHNYAHLRWNRCTTDKPFKCGYCQKSFTAKTSMHDHIRRNHENDEDFISTCAICDVKYPSKEEMDKHLEGHVQLHLTSEDGIHSSSGNLSDATDEGSFFDDENSDQDLNEDATHHHVSSNFCRLMAFLDSWSSVDNHFEQMLHRAVDVKPLIDLTQELKRKRNIAEVIHNQMNEGSAKSKAGEERDRKVPRVKERGVQGGRQTQRVDMQPTPSRIKGANGGHLADMGSEETHDSINASFDQYSCRRRGGTHEPLAHTEADVALSSRPLSHDPPDGRREVAQGREADVDSFIFTFLEEWEEASVLTGEGTLSAI